MLDLLQALWECVANVLGLVPDFIWTAVGATVPIAVAAQLAIRKIAHERRFDKNLSIYSVLYRATDRVATNAPGSDQDPAQDAVAAAAFDDMLEAYDEAQLHVSPRSRVALQNLFGNLRMLMIEASDKESTEPLLAHRRANMLLKEMPEQILVLGRRDLYGNEAWEKVSFKLFWRRDRRRIIKVFERVWEDSLKDPLPLE